MTGTDYTERFEQLLELFPHPERTAAPTPQQRAWRMVEIERETGGEVSSSWLSALRRRKTKKPGMRMLDLIARAMGFPFELWLAEPEQWPRILRDRGIHYSAGGAVGASRAVPGERDYTSVSAEDLDAMRHARSSDKMLLYKAQALEEEQVELLVSMAEHLRSLSSD